MQELARKNKWTLYLKKMMEYKLKPEDTHLTPMYTDAFLSQSKSDIKKLILQAKRTPISKQWLEVLENDDPLPQQDNESSKSIEIIPQKANESIIQKVQDSQLKDL